MIYDFEGFSLDVDRRELRSSDKLVAIEPLVFDVLHYLICNCDRVVSKDDLIAGVWKGRIISKSTLSGSINAVRHSVDDSGEEQRLIRTVPRKGFRFVGEIRENSDSRGTSAANLIPAQAREADGQNQRIQQAPPLPEKASIAVLPFVNISGDPEQEYFADGITEDIITALSQFRWFFVIARGSSFTYKGKSVDAKQVGQELGIRYLLEGSVRKSGNRVRITGNLIDIATGANLWAGRIDGALEDIFDLQDQVSTSVVGAIAPKIEEAEIARAKLKPTENLDAYDYFLRGMANVHQWTRESNHEALRLFYKAVELDSGFASAYGMLARCYSQRKFSGWMTDQEHETAETDKLSRRAAELGRDVPLALCTAGLGLAYVADDFDYGAALIDRAIEMNPNLAWAWQFSGWLKVLVGEPDAAIERLSRAMRLSPQNHSYFQDARRYRISSLFRGSL